MMTRERLDHIESRIEMRACPIVRNQLRELVVEVRRARSQVGPSTEWLTALMTAAADELIGKIAKKEPR